MNRFEHARKWLPSIRESILHAYYNTGSSDEEQELMAFDILDAALTQAAEIERCKELMKWAEPYLEDGCHH